MFSSVLESVLTVSSSWTLEPESESFMSCGVCFVHRQSLWASRFVSVLVSNRQLVSGLVHRLWELFNNQVKSHDNRVCFVKERPTS